MSENSIEAGAAKGRRKKSGGGGILGGILAVLLALLVVVVVFAGAFYYLVKTNFYGVGEQFRPLLQDHPILKLALPPATATADPNDPSLLTQQELTDKYLLFLKENEALRQKLDAAEWKLSDAAAERAALEILKRDIETAKAEQVAAVTALEQENQTKRDLEAELSNLIAQGDTASFKQYFEQVDPETAREIYAQIVRDESEQTRMQEAAKPYQQMDPGVSATVLTALWGTDRELTLDIMQTLKTQVAAEVLAGMTATTAAEITQSLDDRRAEEADAAAKRMADLLAASAAASAAPSPAPSGTAASGEGSVSGGSVSTGETGAAGTSGNEPGASEATGVTTAGEAASETTASQ